MLSAAGASSRNGTVPLNAVSVGVIVLKGLVGGCFVVLFSLIGETIRPRALAGLTSGAPSVAVAGLLVTVVTSGAMSAWNQSLGMIAGAAGMVVWCLVGTDAVRRFGALRGALVTTPAWFATALALWALLLR